MKAALFAAVLVLAASPAIADINVVGNDQQIKVDCKKDKIINIAGNGAVITLAGTCEIVRITGNKATVKGSVDRVVIDGNDNNLILDFVGGIDVRGNKNTVLYKPAKREKGPQVSNLGNDNHVGPRKDAK